MKKILCSALVVCMLLVMTACGSSDISGKYNFDSMEMEGITLSASDLGDMTMYIELKSDGTGTMVMDTEVTEMEWADGKIWPAGDSDDTASFTVEGSTLTIEQDGIEMVFKK